jgi:hypothetical protein
MLQCLAKYVVAQILALFGTLELVHYFQFPSDLTFRVLTWRHVPILVTCKTLTKSSTYVKFVFTFESST